MTADRTPVLSVSGRVSLDGDCVYVNGMLLANLLRAFMAPETGNDRQSYERMTITVRADQVGLWTPAGSDVPPPF